MSKRKVENDNDRVPFAFLSGYRSEEREDPNNPGKVQVLVESSDINRSQLWCTEDNLGVDMMGMWQDYKNEKFAAETRKLNGTREGRARSRDIFHLTPEELARQVQDAVVALHAHASAEAPSLAEAEIFTGSVLSDDIEDVD